jgi:hypothetical protein
MRPLVEIQGARKATSEKFQIPLNKSEKVIKYIKYIPLIRPQWN